MSETVHVAVIGCGFMGTAILQGLLQSSSDSQTPHQEYSYAACVRSPSSLDRLKSDLASYQDKVEFGYGPESAARMAAKAQIIIIGVAPTDLDSVLQIPGMIEAFRSKVMVSILAGVSYSQLEDELTVRGARQDLCTLIRLLPTLGAKIGESVSLVADSSEKDSTNGNSVLAEALFKRLGSITHVPEQLMNEVTALGAVTHALAIASVDTLADAAAADGIPRPTALKIAAQCLRSASNLFLSGMSPEQMKSAMAVPTGITINAILDLEKSAKPGIADAARKATAYTRKMAQ